MTKMTYLVGLVFSLMITGQFISCSGISTAQKNKIKNENEKFTFTDASGNFQLKREVGLNKNGKQVFVKTQLLPENGSEKNALEKSIVIGELEEIKFKEKKLTILKPHVSQFTVWLEGEKYFSQVKFDEIGKKIEVVTNTSEKKGNKNNNEKKTIKLPENGNGVYCFDSGLIECVKVTNFLKISSEKKAGKMNFNLIWDKYPFLKDSYSQIPDEVLSEASFSYEGETTDGELKYVLSVGDQAIFYHFDKNFNFVKKFWVSQGITQIRSDL
jgi:hypothetical protein